MGQSFSSGASDMSSSSSTSEQRRDDISMSGTQRGRREDTEDADSASVASSEEMEEAGENLINSRRVYNLRSAARTSSSALQNILAVLVGRGDLRSADPSEDEDDDDWTAVDSGEDLSLSAPFQREKPKVNRLCKPSPALLKCLLESDFHMETLVRLGSHIPPMSPQEKSERYGKRHKDKETPADYSCPSKKLEATTLTRSMKPLTGLNQKEIAANKRSAGDTFEPVRRAPKSIPTLVMKRELGDFRHQQRTFSFGQRCQVLETYIPNRMKRVAKYQQKVFCGTYSDCGNIFMSACQDQNIRIHDTSGGEFKLCKIIRARNVGWSVLDTAISPDGRHVIYSSWSDFIYQANVHGEDEGQVALPFSPLGGRFCIFALRFSQDGFEILGGANDGNLYLFDRMASQETLRIDAHDDDVNAVAFVDTTTHILASGGDDGVCKIWDRRSLRESDPRPVGVLAGHIDGLTYIDPRGDGRHLITNSKDQSIKLWDLRRFSTKEAIEESKQAVRTQNWDYRWQGVPRRLAHDRGRPTVRNDSSVMTYRGHTVLQTLIRCRFSPMHTTGQKYIYTGCATGAVVIYDALTGDVVRENKGHKFCVRDVSWHPYQNEMISSSWDSSINQWRYEDPSVTEENTKTQKWKQR